MTPEGRFLRNLRDGRWDKLVPAHQQEDLASFITRAALTPGRNSVLLRFAAGKEKVEYLWAEYEILSADVDKCQLVIRTLFVPDDGHELEMPSGYEQEPFFAVDGPKQHTTQEQQAEAA